MENNREKFLKDLKKGVAGALAGAAILTGATGCAEKTTEQPETSNVEPTEGVSRSTPQERLTENLKSMNYNEMLNVLKRMYINIDKEKNPDSELKEEDLELYYKLNQSTCFYVEDRDAIVLNGQNAWETENKLIQLGEEYKNIGTNGAPMIIVSKDGKTIDGIGSIKIGDLNIDEAPITTPELLNTISADGKTTAQEIPQELWKVILETAIDLQKDDEYTRTVKVPEKCEKISQTIFEYGLQDYIQNDSNRKTIDSYEFVENTFDEGR